MSKPLPCPFCGYEVINAWTRKAKSTASGKHCFVRCPMCNTEGPRSSESEEAAVEKWNKRVGEKS